MLDGGCKLQLQRSVFEGRVVGGPGDHRQPDVLGQLHEVLEANTANLFGAVTDSHIGTNKIVFKLGMSRAVVVVKWLAYSPSTPTIRVRIPLTPTVFTVKFVCEKTENKTKIGRGRPILKGQVCMSFIDSIDMRSKPHGVSIGMWSIQQAFWAVTDSHRYK